MSSPVAQEKRHSYRADVRIPVDYVVEGRSEARSAVVRNVSAGGMRIVGDESFVPGSVVHIRIALPNDLVREVRFEREVEEQTLRGAVRRTVKVPPAPFGELTLSAKLVNTAYDPVHDSSTSGIEFVDLDPAVREELHRFVHMLQLNQLRERADTKQYYREMNRA